MTEIEMRRAQGGKELKTYQEGSSLTLRQRILAKCYECSGGYVDGRVDCRITDCPLYPIMPYGSQKLPKRKVSEETRQRLSEALMRSRRKSLIISPRG